MLGPELDITKVHTNWVLEVGGLGSHSSSQPSPAPNGSDEATADVTKQVPESHWLLNARQTISNWGRALTMVQREARGFVIRLLEVGGGGGREVGGLQAWGRTVSEGEEEEGVTAGACERKGEHSMRTPGPGPGQSRSMEGRNQELSLGHRKAENLIQVVGFMSLELREEARVGDEAGTASASVWHLKPWMDELTRAEMCTEGEDQAPGPPTVGGKTEEKRLGGGGQGGEEGWESGRHRGQETGIDEERKIHYN